MTEPGPIDPDDEEACKRWLERRFGSVEAAAKYYADLEAANDAASDEDDHADWQNGWPPSA